jgi:hypothetical protein
MPAMKRTYGAFYLVALAAAVMLSGCGKKEEASATGTDVGAAGAAGAAATATATATHTAPAHTATVAVNHDSDAQAMRSCCASLRAESGKQHGTADKNKYDSAAVTCDGLVEVVRKTGNRGSAMSSIRAALKGGAPPAGCN